MNCSCSNKIISLSQLTLAILGTAAAGAAFATAFVPTLYAVTGIALPIISGAGSAAAWLALAGIAAYRCRGRKVHVVTERKNPDSTEGAEPAGPAGSPPPSRSIQEQFLGEAERRIQQARKQIDEIALGTEDSSFLHCVLDTIFENVQNFSECIEEGNTAKECLHALEVQIEEVTAIAQALKSEETAPAEKKEKEKEVSQKGINRQQVDSLKKNCELFTFMKQFRDKRPTAEDIEGFKDRLANMDDVNAIRDAGKDSLLMALAKRASPIEFVPVLAERGINFNDRCSFFGNTPLMWAIANGNNEMALALIKANPQQNFDTKDSHKQNSALTLAIVKGYIDKTSDGRRLTVSNLQLVQALLNNKADPNQRDGQGNPPLKFAILRRDPEMVRALLLAGACCDFDWEPLLAWSYEEAKEKLKKTASPFLLDKAAFEENKESVRAILKVDS